MIANFYLIPASFERNNELSDYEIEEKIKALHLDFIKIKKYKDKNKFFIHSDIYSVIFIKNITISDFLFNCKTENKYIDTDVKRALQKIILESAVDEITVDEIVEVLLPNHNNENCYGLIAFNVLENIDNEYQIVYNLNDWYAFRRKFLGMYPKNGDFFIDECKIYFPKLFFHERNKTTVLDIMKECSKKIVFHLSALNDKLNDSVYLNTNRYEMLKHFSISAKLDADATLEGNAENKDNFTFDFLNDSGFPEKVCCEPHLKLCFNDNYPGDSHYSNDRRIYFHEGKPNIQNGKILIGHIGKHL